MRTLLGRLPRRILAEEITEGGVIDRLLQNEEVWVLRRPVTLESGALKLPDKVFHSEEDAREAASRFDAVDKIPQSVLEEARKELK